ncbi:hypothetical protein [Paenibacillus vandeheii]|uniref:hypothetical protein n=1 Tax=Paenibacillus vandeheii TaxID=3035917 RepID=UPI00263A8F71|nr:hypothetical protein [Paenibacillus vandeheii]
MNHTKVIKKDRNIFVNTPDMGGKSPNPVFLSWYADAQTGAGERIIFFSANNRA